MIGEIDKNEFNKFLERFSVIKKEFEMQVKVDFKGEKRKIGLFCSSELHCLVDILGRYQTGELNVEIPYVISNKLDAKGIVEKIGIPFYFVQTKKDSFEHEKDPEFIESVNQKIINVHHSFLPSFIGAKLYDEAFERGVKLIGATSHYVIAELDRGPIIEQQVKRVKHSHGIENLKVIGRECEKEVFFTAIKKHIENKIIVYKNRAIVFE